MAPFIFAVIRETDGASVGMRERDGGREGDLNPRLETRTKLFPCSSESEIEKGEMKIGAFSPRGGIIPFAHASVKLERAKNYRGAR